MSAVRQLRCVVCQTPYSGSERFCPIDGGAIVATTSGDATADGYIGKTIDERYLVRRLIGKGGMGAVYEADHVGLDRTVAIKLMLGKVDADALARFRREARAASRVVHSNVVQIFDVGTDDNNLDYIVMEFLDGDDLNNVMRSAAFRAGAGFSTARAVKIVVQLLRGLGAIHAAGIVHRDIKPANVLLLANDIVKLTDFGIAKSTDAEGTQLTETGHIIGTLKYMSPEQLSGLPPNPRTDLYATGLVLYEMLAGRAPFESHADAKLAAMIMSEPSPSLAHVRADASLELVVAIDRVLSKDPNDRYANAAELIAALEAAPVSDEAVRAEVAGADAPTKAGSGRKAVAGPDAATKVASRHDAPPNAAGPSAPTIVATGPDAPTIAAVGSNAPPKIGGPNAPTIVATGPDAATKVASGSGSDGPPKIGGPDAPTIAAVGSNAPPKIGGPNAPTIVATGPDAATKVVSGSGSDGPPKIGGPDAPTVVAMGPDTPTIAAVGPNAPTLEAGGTDAPTIAAAGPGAPTKRESVARAPVTSGSEPEASTSSTAGPNVPNNESGPDAPTKSESARNVAVKSESGADASTNVRSSHDAPTESEPAPATLPDALTSPLKSALARYALWGAVTLVVGAGLAFGIHAMTKSHDEPGGPARVQDDKAPSEVEAEIAKARAAEDADQDDVAIAHYRVAYANDHRPQLLLRIAALQEHAGSKQEAAAALREYLKASPDAADRGSVEARIALLNPPAVAEAIAADAGVPEAAEDARPGDKGKPPHAGATAKETPPSDPQTASNPQTGSANSPPAGALKGGDTVPAGTQACVCIPAADDGFHGTSALCPSVGTLRHCDCRSASSDRLYTSFDNDGTDDRAPTGHTAASASFRDGGECGGRTTPTSREEFGKLSNCYLDCNAKNASYVGRRGQPCAGHSTYDGALLSGVLDCSRATYKP